MQFDSKAAKRGDFQVVISAPALARSHGDGKGTLDPDQPVRLRHFFVGICGGYYRLEA